MPVAIYLVLFSFLLTAVSSNADQLSATDQRTVGVKTLNTPRTFPVIKSKDQWKNRAAEIREQILVSAGLWPMPEKTPLNASVFGKIAHEDYTVEKVYFESLPGFFVCGNLYRPMGRGHGPFAAVLNPHGHWPEGRLVDTTNGSVAARCINFAKQGMIAFSYDMVGYNDTHFPLPPNYKHTPETFYATHRHFATNTPAPMLWNINLMGLQLWNSIRALDFLEELAEVDKMHIAITGASGGGTQTFMLGAIDDRLAEQGPVVMVSHTMQGGCGCENMPGLRVEFSNMEIAAAAAPRPQIMVGASGDWTKDMMTVEGPAVESVYKLFDATDLLRFVRYDSNHNYNKTSREAVYGWFDKFLMNSGDGAPVKEAAYTKDPDGDLRVFPDNKLPSQAISEQELINYLIERTRKQLEKLTPHGKASLAEYKNILQPAWKRTLQLDVANKEVLATFDPKSNVTDDFTGCTSTHVTIGRSGKGDRISAVMFRPAQPANNNLVILLSDKGKTNFLDSKGLPSGLARELVDANQSVITFDLFSAPTNRNQVDLFYATYNKTTMQERVQDIATVCAMAHGPGPVTNKIVLIGEGNAGLAAILAAPLVDAVIADCRTADNSDLFRVRPDVFVPGLRSIGDFIGAATLAAPNPILVCAGYNKLSVGPLKEIYKDLHSTRAFQSEYAWPNDQAIVKWVAKLK
ncbi:MAG: alpha/beta hydrolase: peptidase or carbohydrate esterase [Verrucomicrobiales bacterium]|nr:alpha/beta hydrolase: peptidase or carbohydrate esterase [Verrucomicrobiales bacterium]